MPLYVSLTNLTEQGRKTIKSRPERVREVNKEIVSMGGKIVAQYATLGPYDFVTIIEADSNEAVMSISIELSARGTLSVITLPAIEVDRFISRAWAPPSTKR
ncbi:MAG: GYD domain-containing protein [Dehalococcoidia bacterium]|jgi:uncharacterized protein with GYD domain